MRRWMNALRMELRVQRRYGFVYAAAFSVLVWLALLRAVPATSLPALVPAIVFLDLALVGFYFIAGLVLFEKGEATLYALVVSPLRFWEYLSAKLASLTALALALSVALVAFSYGLHVNLGLVLLGTALMALIALLVGFIAVAPFSSFSSYLIPSQIYALVLYLPLIEYIGWWHSPLFYLLPTHGAMLLLHGAFVGVAAWQVAYALGYGALWIAGLSWLAQRMFNRSIVARQGRR